MFENRFHLMAMIQHLSDYFSIFYDLPPAFWGPHFERHCVTPLGLSDILVTDKTPKVNINTSLVF